MIYENIGAFASRITCFSSFVDTTQAFPRPLSPEDEEKALNAMRKGDKKAREKLITHNLRLVAHIVKKFPNTLEADDLISVGTIGLIKAIDTYKPGKNVKLATYASRCITNEILMLIRANKKHKEVISLSTAFATDKDDNRLELADIISAEEGDDQVLEMVEQDYMVSRVKKVIDEKLSPLEKEVIYARYALDGGDFLAQKEVAKKMNISRSYVSRIEKSAMETLKENLSESEKK